MLTIRPGDVVSREAPRRRPFPPPVVACSRVLFAPDDDSSEVHCLDLRDGSLLWKVKRAGALYLAGVYGEKVLLVGPDRCRALALRDGKELWTKETGKPCGRGVVARAAYYLPLQDGQLQVIELADGWVEPRIKPRKAGPPLGNLLFHQDAFIAQSATQVTVYPRRALRLKAVRKALRKNPNDPAALTELSILHFTDGEIERAVEDLRRALDHKPPKALLPRTRLLLFEALEEFFQTDFNTAVGKYLDEFRKQCRTDNPAETRRRRARLQYLVGRGREGQGKLVAALRHYLAFAEVLGRQRLITAPDDRKRRVRAVLWVRGQLKAMYSRATARQRQALDAELEKHWQALSRPKKAKE
jgi:hypothetical protein